MKLPSIVRRGIQTNSIDEFFKTSHEENRKDAAECCEWG